MRLEDKTADRERSVFKNSLNMMDPVDGTE
jgi:hypothetical protein